MKDKNKKKGDWEDIIVPVHPAGYPFIGIFLLIMIFSMIIWGGFLIITLPLFLWCIYFFRDPERIIPDDEKSIVSPADGIIQTVAVKPLPKEMIAWVKKNKSKPKDYTRISIFMNVFNVHVNRMPCDCKVIANHYHKGQFLNASLDKSSSLNERQSLWLLSERHKTHIGLVQIAGLIAKRILCDAKKNTKWQKGQRFGMIRFGSRLDIFLPKNVKILVKEGQTAIAGETRLAEW